MPQTPENLPSDPEKAEIQPQNEQNQQIPEQKQENSQQAEQMLHQNSDQNQDEASIDEQSPESQKDNPELKPDEQLKPDQQNSNQLSNRIQNHAKNTNLNPSSNQKIPSCHCKKSKCLKMYCDCFAKGNKCRETCKCIGCENTKNSNQSKKPDSRNDEEIERSEDSNKKSLKPKERSCNCKKSFCLKKYCECYNANIPCTESCKCQDCKNNGENNNFRDDKTPGSVPIVEPSILNGILNKQVSEGMSEPNDTKEKKEDLSARKRQKPDEDEIQTKISQILRLVPHQNYQTMLDFLAYCLS